MAHKQVVPQLNSSTSLPAQGERTVSYAYLSYAWLFWGSFWLLNWLLFTPIYLFQQAEMSMLPELGQLDWRGWLQQRENLDVFRFNLELGLLALLWLTVPWLRRPFFLLFAFLLYLLQLLYGAYEGFIRTFYQIEPNGYNDWPLIFRGTGYVIESLDLPTAVYLGGLFLILLLGGLLFGLHRLLFNAKQVEQLHRGHSLALALVVLLALGLNWQTAVSAAHPQAVISSFTAKLNDNMALAQTTRAAHDRFALGHLAPFYEFTNSQLLHKPNIHIIFIESYGSVLYKRDDYKMAYTALLPYLEEQLEQSGWSAYSALSDAPTWGGGSWIAYTSFLFGLNLESDSEYRQLLAEYENRPFPHIVNFLRGQGYRSYRLTSSANELSDNEWQQLIRFFGVDEWFRFYDVVYDGPLYGWGPSMPDQYILNYGLEQIKATESAPYTLFFITQNSHYPWYPLPDFVEDWRTLPQVEMLEETAVSIPHEELRRRYLAAIEYQLEMLVDLIIKQGEDDDIFILIGDHQPARVARYSDGWDTPVHIISRDSDFTAAFAPFDFVPGLMLSTIEPTIHHAGFYSLFSHILIQQYGPQGATLPIYRPLGADLHTEGEP